MIPGFEETLTKMLEIARAKNNDYAGENNDPFKNFKLAEELGVCTTEDGMVVRMTDKLSRITNLLHSDAKVKDEKIEDTLLDLANYSIILKCYIEHKNNVMKQKEVESLVDYILKGDKNDSY